MSYGVCGVCKQRMIIESYGENEPNERKHAVCPLVDNDGYLVFPLSDTAFETLKNESAKLAELMQNAYRGSVWWERAVLDCIAALSAVVE